MPKLVSIDDVRAHTQLPDSLTRDPLPPRRVSSASAMRRYRGERTMVDSSLPPSMTPEGTQAAAAAASVGLRAPRPFGRAELAVRASTPTRRRALRRCWRARRAGGCLGGALLPRRRTAPRRPPRRAQ